MIKRAGLVSLAMFVGFMLTTGTVMAQASVEGHWEPYSKTATAITGPVIIQGNELNILGKPRFTLAPSDIWPSEFVLAGVSGDNPVLLNGNTICPQGDQVSRMVAKVENSLLTLTFYGKSHGAASAAHCGQYSYISVSGSNK